MSNVWCFSFLPYSYKFAYDSHPVLAEIIHVTLDPCLIIVVPFILFRHAIMKGLALSLELNDDFFLDKFTPAFPLLALWHYPPVPAESDSWGVGPHTDYGVLTLLMQDDVGGLQIETKGGDWIDVPPVPGKNS